MFRFLLGRLAVLIPTFIGVSIIAFSFIRLLPGDPVMLMSGERVLDVATGTGDLAIELKRRVGDSGEVIALDFSERSWELNRPVSEMIATAVPPSLLITIPTLTLTALIAICVALVSV